MHPLIWPIVLMLVGLAMIVLEVFVPSGGVIGFLSMAAVMASVGLAFYEAGPTAGLVFLAIAAGGVPTLLVLAFRWWPHTPMGRRVLLNLPTSEEVLPDSPQRRMLRQLVGKYGVAKSKMMPSGAVLVDGVTVDAVGEGVAIEPGQRVRVIEVRGNHVLVRPVSADEAPQANPKDILSQPIDSLGLDPFEDPLA